MYQSGAMAVIAIILQFLSSLDDAKAIEEKLCDPSKLPSLLTLPKSTSLTYANISEAICDLQPALAAEIAVELVRKMDIGDIIEAVSYLNIFSPTVS